jgi:hypothetical protein
MEENTADIKEERAHTLINDDDNNGSSAFASVVEEDAS